MSICRNLYISESIVEWIFPLTHGAQNAEELMINLHLKNARHTKLHKHTQCIEHTCTQIFTHPSPLP